MAEYMGMNEMKNNNVIIVTVIINGMMVEKKNPIMLFSLLNLVFRKDLEKSE